MTSMAAAMDASSPMDDNSEPPLASQPPHVPASTSSRPLRPCLISSRLRISSSSSNPHAPHVSSPLALSPSYDITPDMTEASHSGSSSPASSRQPSRDGDLPLLPGKDCALAGPGRPGAGVRMLSWSLLHADTGVGPEEDEDAADQAEAYMRSGLIALRLFAAEHAQAHAQRHGRRRKHVAWAGDSEQDESPSSENVSSDEEGSVMVPPQRQASPAVPAQAAVVTVAQEDHVEDWIDEDGQVWQHHVDVAAGADADGRPLSHDRRAEVALVSIHFTYSPSEYDRTPLDPPTEEERACSLPDRGARVCADAYDRLASWGGSVDIDGRASSGPSKISHVKARSKAESKARKSKAASKAALAREILACENEWSLSDDVLDTHSLAIACSPPAEEYDEDEEDGELTECAVTPSAEKDEDDCWEAWLDQRKAKVCATSSACKPFIEVEPPSPPGEGESSDTPSLASTTTATDTSMPPHGLEELVSPPTLSTSPGFGAGELDWLPHSYAYGRPESPDTSELSDATPMAERPRKAKRSPKAMAARRAALIAAGDCFGSSPFEGEGCLGGF